MTLLVFMHCVTHVYVQVQLGVPTVDYDFGVGVVRNESYGVHTRSLLSISRRAVGLFVRRTVGLFVTAKQWTLSAF